MHMGVRKSARASPRQHRRAHTLTQSTPRFDVVAVINSFHPLKVLIESIINVDEAVLDSRQSSSLANHFDARRCF